MTETTGMCAWSLEDIFAVEVPAGKVALAWCNSYSGIVLRTPRVTAIFDPVGVPALPFVKADLLAVTHEHPDHWEARSLAGLQRRTKALLVTTPFVGERMERLIPGDRVRALRPGDSLATGDVVLVALRADHPGHGPLAFLMRTDDGPTLYFPGDGRPSRDTAAVGQEWAPDALVYMGTALEEGAQILRMVRPRTLLTYSLRPPEAQERARAILCRWAPDVHFKALERHEVWVYP